MASTEHWSERPHRQSGRGYSKRASLSLHGFLSPGPARRFFDRMHRIYGMGREIAYAIVIMAHVPGRLARPEQKISEIAFISVQFSQPATIGRGGVAPK